jgi:hypothetical protein
MQEEAKDDDVASAAPASVAASVAEAVAASAAEAASVAASVAEAVAASVAEAAFLAASVAVAVAASVAEAAASVAASVAASAVLADEALSLAKKQNDRLQAELVEEREVNTALVDIIRQSKKNKNPTAIKKKFGALGSSRQNEFTLAFKKHISEVFVKMMPKGSVEDCLIMVDRAFTDANPMRDKANKVISLIKSLIVSARKKKGQHHVDTLIKYGSILVDSGFDRDSLEEFLEITINPGIYTYIICTLLTHN